MAGLTSKYLKGESQIENKDFNISTFQEAGVWKFNVDEITRLKPELMGALNGVLSSYQEIVESFSALLSCTTDGTTMQKGSGDVADKIHFIIKKSKKRLEIAERRKKQMETLFAQTDEMLNQMQQEAKEDLETAANELESADDDLDETVVH